jgi:gas vesicle structural protein
VVFEHKRSSGELSDVLDRVLDKGIVIDASIRVALIGIDLVSVHARIVVASVETYLRYNEALAAPSLMARTPVALAQSASSAEAAMIMHGRSQIRSRKRTA